MANGHALIASETAAPVGQLRRRLVGSLALVGLWSIPALIAASQNYLLYNSDGSGFLAILSTYLPPWLYWALVTPIILVLGRRFPLEGKIWPTSVAVHLIANIVLGAGHVGVTAATGIAAGQTWFNTLPLGAALVKLATKNIVLDLLTYWGVLGAAHAFEYQRRFRERALAAAHLETKLFQAQLEALKMQLHPHFLFNTLHAITMLVRKQDAQGSIRMITGLSDLLRLTLDTVGQQLVPLKQEMDFIVRYLDIEAVRFQDRLVRNIDVAHDALDAMVPNLILQPIVENAIRHGISARAEAGQLEIVARRHGDQLVITVRDDGPGPGASWRPGLGLTNVRARLAQLYPDRYRLSLAADPAGGARVTVEMPFAHG